MHVTFIGRRPATPTTPAIVTAPRSEAYDYRPSEKSELNGESWNVVLLDDDDHTYPYVIEMLHRLFGHDVYRALALTQEVDSTGRVVVFTGSKKDAEWGRDAINSYGADPRLPRSRSSMAAIIESVGKP